MLTGAACSAKQDLPAANANALRLILEMLHYASLQSTANGCDAATLAQVFAPLLLWRPALPKPAPTPLSAAGEKM